MADPKITECKKCGAPIWNDSVVSFCGRCLLMGAIDASQVVRKSSTEEGRIKGRDNTGPQKGSNSRPDFEIPGIEELQELFPELEIIELLGAGGMGAVFKARQPRLDRYVAVKILSKRLAEDPEFIARFQREAKAMAKLDHPNIVTIYDFGDRGGFHYFIMEFVDGGDLHQLIAAGKLDPSAVLEMIPQICEAIQFAHEEGVTHRDIKPANILLDTKGRVKIADFGLAKILAGTSEISLTMSGSAMGTPFYMAPEQLINSDNVDQRADIYSLGVVLYQLLTGVLPHGDFAPPSKTLPELSPSIDNAVMRALAQDPELRFTEVREMLDALELVREARQKQNGQAKFGFGKWAVSAFVVVLLVSGIAFLTKSRWSDDGSNRAVSAIEPPNTTEPKGRNNSPGKLGNKILEPQLPSIQPGRLRGILTNLDGDVSVMDLDEIEKYDDIIQFRSTHGGETFPGIFALRSNGEIVAGSLNPVWVDDLARLNLRGPFRYLGYPHHSMHHLVVITANGTPVPLLSGHSMHRNFPNPTVPVVDVRTAEGHALMLCEDGRAYAWGDDFTKTDDPWPMPSADFLTNVAEIRANADYLFARKRNGDVSSWGQRGDVLLPEEMRRNISAIAVYDTRLATIDFSGELRMTSFQTVVEIDELFSAEKVSALKDQGFHNKVYRSSSKIWTPFPSFNSTSARRYKGIFDQCKKLQEYPADAFAIGGHTQAEYRFLIWIEPVD